MDFVVLPSDSNLNNMKDYFEIFFHLGLPKVASTYLQKNIFPFLTDVTFFPKHQYKKYININQTGLKGKYLFSSEKLKRLGEEVENITKIYPSAKIILIFRRHDDWLKSRYKYHIRKNGHETFNEFFNLEQNNGLWKKEDLIYQDKVKLIESLCNEKPLVLTFDQLKNNPDAFVNRILQYLDTGLKPKAKKNKRVNKAFKEKQLIILRKYNSIYPYKPSRSKIKILRRIHVKYRQFLLHIVAFFSQLVPGSLVAEKKLLTTKNIETLREAKKYYANDWEFIKNYSSKNL